MWKFISGVITGIGGLVFFTKTELGKGWIKNCKNSYDKGIKKINGILNPSTKEE